MSINPFRNDLNYLITAYSNDENSEPPEVSSLPTEEPVEPSPSLSSSSSEPVSTSSLMPLLFCDETIDPAQFSSSTPTSSSAPITYSPQKPSASEIEATRKRLERPIRPSFLSRIAEASLPSSSAEPLPEVWVTLDSSRPGALNANLTDGQFSLKSQQIYKNLSETTVEIVRRNKYLDLAQARMKNYAACYEAVKQEIFYLQDSKHSGTPAKKQRQD
jgi:hypothetical protein